MHRDGALMQAYCDFDGTITTIDVTDAVLERFAAPKWRDIEQAWEAGRIDARQCMSAQITLIQAAMNQIDEFLDTVKIDPEFPEFVRWCLRNSIPVTVVSDGDVQAEATTQLQHIYTAHGVGSHLSKTA